MSRRVLVTRPEPGASATARRLEAMGFVPVLLPLTRIVPVEPPPLSDPDRYDAVAVTSANALRHAPQTPLGGLREKPFFAVGDGTAEAARQAGFRDVRPASGTAARLAATIAATISPGRRILHFAGTLRTPGFEETLRQGGLAVEIAEVYEAREIEYAPEFVKDVLAGETIWGATVFSARGGALLAGLASNQAVRNAFEGTRFFCISHKAAAPLRRRASARIWVGEEPGEDGVLLALSSQA